MVCCQQQRYFRRSRPCKIASRPAGFANNLPTSFQDVAYSSQKSGQGLTPTFLKLLKQNSSYPLRYGIKKKSDVMRTIEKIQRKQESINHPLSIKLVVKIVATAVGFYVWGIDFIWVVLGVVFCWNILKGIASCLFSLIALIGFIWFLFTHIF